MLDIGKLASEHEFSSKTECPTMRPVRYYDNQAR